MQHIEPDISFTNLNVPFLFIFILFFQNIVRKIENTQTKTSDRPVKDVVIADCDILPVEKPFPVAKEDATE